MDGFENKPLPVENLEAQNDGVDDNDTSDAENKLQECSILMRKNLQNERIDTDNDGNPDELLQTWEDCDGDTVSRVINIDNSRGGEDDNDRDRSTPDTSGGEDTGVGGSESGGGDTGGGNQKF